MHGRQAAPAKEQPAGTAPEWPEERCRALRPHHPLLYPAPRVSNRSAYRANEADPIGRRHAVPNARLGRTSRLANHCLDSF
jgi:hypothetical protein